MELRYPGAKFVAIPNCHGAGPMVGGFTPKIVHHTTQGASIGGAESTYASTHNLPHFTDAYVDGKYVVHQHLDLNVAATALMHPAGTVDTNRGNSIQIEHVGFANTSSQWADGYLSGIAALCRWIEAQTGCPPVAHVSFLSPRRLSEAEWKAYGGHVGHVHVPNNTHTDPGPIDIVRILKRGTVPQFEPPLAIAAWAHHGAGTVGVAPDGAVFCDPPELYRGGPNGQGYWGARRAARVRINSAADGSYVGYTIWATDQDPATAAGYTYP